MKTIKCEMAGTVLEVKVKAGQPVKEPGRRLPWWSLHADYLSRIVRLDYEAFKWCEHPKRTLSMHLQRHAAGWRRMLAQFMSEFRQKQ